MATRWSIRLTGSTLDAGRRLEEGEPPYTAPEPPPATDIIALRADRVVRDMALPALVIGAQPVGAGTTITEWTATVEAIVAEQKGCEEPATRAAREIDGRPAVVLTYPHCPEDLQLFHVWTAVVDGELGYHLVWFDEIGHQARDALVLDGILGSFEFSSPPS